jgi:CYTH domain-containing protein
LETRKLALRIREIGRTRWITLKGPSHQTNWGDLVRVEIELPWSQDNLNRVVKELKDRRIGLPQNPKNLDRTRPLDAMKSMGLEVIQDRDTHRKVRSIVFRGKKSGPVVAELSVDSVIYHFSDQEVFHREVEIEGKVNNASIVLKTMIENLLEKYGGVLRKWDHSKLATGKAIEKLLGEKALEGFLDMNNSLKPDAYDKIDAYLQRPILGF